MPGGLPGSIEAIEVKIDGIAKEGGAGIDMRTDGEGTGIDDGTATGTGPDDGTATGTVDATTTGTTTDPGRLIDGMTEGKADGTATGTPRATIICAAATKRAKSNFARWSSVSSSRCLPSSLKGGYGLGGADA